MSKGKTIQNLAELAIANGWSEFDFHRAVMEGTAKLFEFWAGGRFLSTAVQSEQDAAKNAMADIAMTIRYVADQHFLADPTNPGGTE